MNIHEFRKVVIDNSVILPEIKTIKDFIEGLGLEYKPVRAVVTYEAQRNIAEAKKELFINLFPDETWIDNFLVQPLYDPIADSILMNAFSYEGGIEEIVKAPFWCNIAHEQYHANSAFDINQDLTKGYQLQVGFNHQSLIDGVETKSGQTLEELGACYVEFLLKEEMVKAGIYQHIYSPSQINDYDYHGISNRLQVKAVGVFNTAYTEHPEWLKFEKKYEIEDLSYNIHTNYQMMQTLSMDLFGRYPQLWELFLKSRINPEYRIHAIEYLSNLQFVLITKEGIQDLLNTVESFSPDFFCVAGDLLDSVFFVFTKDEQKLDMYIKPNGGYAQMSVLEMLPDLWECLHINHWLAFNIQRLRFLMR